MANVIEVAECILRMLGPTSSLKLQHLVYYSQAWHLVWNETPLFNEKIEAWRNGPVVPVLFKKHKGHFILEPGFFLNGDTQPELSEEEQSSINGVISYYGQRDPHWLSQLSHMEDPWKNARSTHLHTDHHHNHQAEEIPLSAMLNYYQSIQRSK